MRNLLFATLTCILASSAAAQPNPANYTDLRATNATEIKCSGVPTWGAIERDNVVAEITQIHTFFMGPGYNGGYDERVSAFKARANKTLWDFSEARRNLHAQVVCTYTGTDWATNKRTAKTMRTSPGFAFKEITSRTTNGDWKGGPDWVTDPAGNRVVLTWVTGGKKKATTYVTVPAALTKPAIQHLVDQEVAAVRTTLVAKNIPTEPPQQPQPQPPAQ